MAPPKTGWRAWGDHPIIVTIIVITAIIGAAAAIRPYFSNKVQKLEYLGRVVDNKIQSPIHSAKVTLDFRGAPQIVFTDSEGVYRFEIELGTEDILGQVHVEAEGYSNYDRNITLSPNQPKLEDIRLNPIVVSLPSPAQVISSTQVGTNDTQIPTEVTLPTMTFTPSTIPTRPTIKRTVPPAPSKTPVPTIPPIPSNTPEPPIPPPLVLQEGQHFTTDYFANNDEAKHPGCYPVTVDFTSQDGIYTLEYTLPPAQDCYSGFNMMLSPTLNVSQYKSIELTIRFSDHDSRCNVYLKDEAGDEKAVQLGADKMPDAIGSAKVVTVSLSQYTGVDLTRLQTIIFQAESGHPTGTHSYSISDVKFIH